MSMLGERGGYRGITLDELSVIVHQAKESPKFGDFRWWLPFKDDLDLCRVHA